MQDTHRQTDTLPKRGTITVLNRRPKNRSAKPYDDYGVTIVCELKIVTLSFLMRCFMRALVLNILLLVVFSTASRADEVPLVGNSERGKTLFQQACALCHASGREQRLAAGQGPLLAGVVGRPAASLSNFGYTKALESSHLTWDAATLDRFLAGPTALVPGTNMVITVANPADRSDLIAFLATLRPIAPPEQRADVASLRRVPTSGDWQNDRPGMRHRIRLEDLPAPYATVSAGNSPRTVDRPAGARLSVPPGFHVKLFASGLSGPRLLRIAPNGDIFIAETRRGRIRVLRAADGADAPSENTIFADNLEGPFGIGFYPLGGNPQWVYVANLNSIVRFPYHNGDLQARGPAETVVAHLADTTGGHTTRDIAFSLDGKRMFISVGSGSNVADGMPAKSPTEIQDWQATHARGSAWGYEANRADIMYTDPEGRRSLKIFATGIRNAVGLAIQPATGELWTSVNERDALGDDLVPDYITRVRGGGFYGWPWYRRQRLAQLGDILIGISGGEGLEHLALEYSTKGKPVIPLDLNLGAAQHDGSGGASRLFSRALARPKEFFEVVDGMSAVDLLDRTRTLDGSVDPNIVVSALIALMEALLPPRVFYVRLLNPDLPEYTSVEGFFRTTVDMLVKELGYEPCQMGLGVNKFAWMNEAIFQSLHHCSVVLVDATGVRPNCFMELGYALGNKQRVIATHRKDTKLPFDSTTIESFPWTEEEDPSAQLSRFRTHWLRNINMPAIVRPLEAR